MKSLPELIRSSRDAKQLTQAKLGEAVGVHESTVSQWESGTRTPRGPSLAALARELGWTVSELGEAICGFDSDAA